MIRQNLHTHTVYDDGKNTPTEMARAALDAGLASLGFSGHSILPWQNEWTMTSETEKDYRKAVSEAKARFPGQLEIFCGLEWDALSPVPWNGYDYVIGSLHHILADGMPHSVDEAPDVTRSVLENVFSGYAVKMAEAYYAQYEALAECGFVDIVGHFDLITKFDESDGFFTAAEPEFRDAAVTALDLLCRRDKIFEVNTGAMSRGWRTSPYPSLPLLKELRSRNARILISSDAHTVDGIDHAFGETETLLRDLGFREIWHYSSRGFVSVPLM